MAKTIQAQRIRLQIDPSKWSNAPTDIITSQSPKIANGADLQFELCFSYGDLLTDGSNLADMSNWSSMTMAIHKNSDRGGVPIWSKTILNAALDNTVTYASWIAGTAQHALVTVANADNRLLIENTQDTFWIVITIQTSDTPAKQFAGTAFGVIVQEVGLLVYPPSGITTVTYYTQVQSDARYAQLTGAVFSGNVQVNTGLFDSLGHKVVGDQQAAIADFVAAGGWTDSTAYTDFSNLVTKLNAALAALRAHGLIAT